MSLRVYFLTWFEGKLPTEISQYERIILKGNHYKTLNQNLKTGHNVLNFRQDDTGDTGCCARHYNELKDNDTDNCCRRLNGTKTFLEVMQETILLSNSSIVTRKQKHHLFFVFNIPSISSHFVNPSHPWLRCTQYRDAPRSGCFVWLNMHITLHHRPSPHQGQNRNLHILLYMRIEANDVRTNLMRLRTIAAGNIKEQVICNLLS